MIRALAIGIACVLAYTANAAVAADALGRLFFTPTQRVQLDAARAQRDRRAPALATTDTEQAAPQGPEVVTYSGVVRRNDGKSTVWINGKPITERSAGNPEISLLNVRRDGAVSVAVPQADRTASLKVGQSLDVTSGTIEESYARRATIPRPPGNSAPSSPTTSTLKPPVAVAAPTAVTQRAARRDAKESDPDSGAAPPVERGTGK